MTDNKLTSLGEIGKTIDVNNIYKNLLKANSETADDIQDPRTFRDYVRGGGEWDYKANEKTIYGLANQMANEGKVKQTEFLFLGKTMEAQDIGNHHFAVVGKATGLFTELFMLKQAGEAQMTGGTSKPEWQKYKTTLKYRYNGGTTGSYVEEREMLPPYGDDPRDQNWIKEGYKYYNENRGNLDGDWW